jgi:hypothetical protein
MHHRDEGKIEHLWILGLVLAAIVGSFLLQPSVDGCLEFRPPGVSGKWALPETCASRMILGVSCPGCGLTRSFVAMSQGNLYGALTFNLMGPFLYVLCWLQIPYRIVEYFQLGASSGLWISLTDRLHWVTWSVAIGLVAAWVVRVLSGGFT